MKTLKELLDAIERGEVAKVQAMVDNDVVTFYEVTEDGEDPFGDDLLRLHPYEVQMQALKALGIEAEPV